MVFHALWENRLPSVYVPGNEYENNRIKIYTGGGAYGKGLWG